MRPYDGSEAIGVDRYLERQTRGEKGGPIRFRCLDCSFQPGTPISAFQHHAGTRPHHRIETITGLRQQFSCCKGQAHE